MQTRVNPRLHHVLARLRIADFGLNAGQLRLLDPCPYIDFLGLQTRATVVITDSGGIQEETTYLGVPCLTVSREYRAPDYSLHWDQCTGGPRSGETAQRIVARAQRISKEGNVPPLWDGRAWLGSRHTRASGEFKWLP